MSKETVVEKKKVKCVALVDIPDYLGYEGKFHCEDKNEAIFELRIGENDYFNGHQLAIIVGREYHDRKLKSYIFKDKEDDSTKYFEKLREDVELIKTKHTRLLDDVLVPYYNYFIPYQVIGHSSLMPTIENTYVDHCSNVDYTVEYEILFVEEEGMKRYLTLEFQTSGHFACSFFSMIEDIEEELEALFKTETKGFRKNEEYDSLEVAFYQETGQTFYLGFESIDDLLSRVASIRVIKLERKIID